MSRSPSSAAACTDTVRALRREYGAVLCGGGPAATGVIVCAAQDGRLDELLEHGVLVIEQNSALGPGSIGHYRITGNTPATTFVGWLGTPDPDHPLADVAADPATEELLQSGSSFPPLRLVGPYLERLGHSLQRILESHARCGVALGTAVRSVCVLADGGVRVTAGPIGEAAAFSVAARHAVIAMGGGEPPALETLSLLPGLTLDRYADKLCHASALIDDRLGLPPHLVEAVRETRSAVVVGGSHSAWSAAWLLLHDAAFRGSSGEPPEVTVLHRRPPVFFHLTAADARAAGDVFDEALDVCPSSGHVHRYGGLRAPDARALALAAIGPATGSRPVRSVLLIDQPEIQSDVRRSLDAAGVVVAAVGYRPRLPELAWEDGRPIEPAMSDRGLVVTSDAALVTADGTVIPELLAYGLGAGLTADSGLACEPSYAGRLDAVRLYQCEVGRIALESLLADRPAPALR